MNERETLGEDSEKFRSVVFITKFVVLISASNDISSSNTPPPWQTIAQHNMSC